MTNDNLPTFEDFFAAFNYELSDLGCGAMVVPCPDDSDMMLVVDLDGMPIGRVTKEIAPKAFHDMMLIVEESFAQGIEWARANPIVSHPPEMLQ